MAAIVAKSATKTIPIVFTASGDPVKLGFESLKRPHTIGTLVPVEEQFTASTPEVS